MTTEPLRRRIQGLLPRSLRHQPLDVAFLVLLAIVVFLQYGIVPSIIMFGQGMNRPQI
jgi:hypothetical protein